MNEVSERIAGEISGRGSITFARFMELSLYCPNYGYYEKEGDIIGRRGDYYTSVSVGSLFGELLAFQFADWLRGSQARQIVEAGAHRGDLAKDLLTWFTQHRQSLFQELEYWVVEPSDRMRNVQRAHLREFADKVRWANELSEITGQPGAGGVRGVIFSNELLDAMPVHRFGWNAQTKSWFEWGVALESGRFKWKRLAESALALEFRDACSRWLSHGTAQPALWQRLPDGFTAEWCPTAEQWWRGAASALAHGRLLTLDYGLTAEESFVPGRKDGSLRAFQKHQISADVLSCPGDQDITAHVNFTAIRAAGESVGLRTEALQSQTRFLMEIARRVWEAPASFGKWTSHYTRQFQTLTHPEHLGSRFRALVQSRP